MVFALLKRKFFATEEYEHDAPSDPTSRPTKRMRVEDLASIREAKSHHSQTGCAEGGSVEDDEVCYEEDEEETDEELSAKVKEAEEMGLRFIKEAEQERAKVKKLQEVSMACMLCQEIIQNPQLMECGHSACYVCLRKWWTQPPKENDDAPMIDTDAESDIDEEEFATHAPNVNDFVSEPRPRRRHRFHSAVKRPKWCPYCNKELTRRPTPSFRQRDIANDLLPVPPNPQATREPRLPRREDIWHGIFYPETASQGLAPNDLSQVQRLRADEDALEAEERARVQAHAEGWAAGALEARLDRAKAEQERRAMAQPRTAQTVRFGR